MGPDCIQLWENIILQLSQSFKGALFFSEKVVEVV